MKRRICICAVIFLLAGMCLYLQKAEKESMKPESLDKENLNLEISNAESINAEAYTEILTDSNVVDAGNHVAVYRISAEEVDTVATLKESFQGDYIVLYNLYADRIVYLPDTYGTILYIEAGTMGEITLGYICEENGEEQQLRIPNTFQPQAVKVLDGVFFDRHDRVLEATQELDTADFPVKVWEETFVWDGETYEAAFQRTSPVYGIQGMQSGLYADYCLTVKDGKEEIVSSQAVVNFPIDYEEVYWFTDFSGDGFPDIAVCTAADQEQMSWSCLHTWIWDGKRHSYQEKYLGYLNTPLWNKEQCVIVSFAESEAEGSLVINEHLYNGYQWELVKTWTPLYEENLQEDEAGESDSYKKEDYLDGEQYCQLYPDAEWEKEILMIGEIPVNKYVRVR